MTIKVEREALLRVLSRQPSSSYSLSELQIPSDEEEFVLVDIPKPYLEQGPCSYFDDDSLCTLSTSSDSFSTDSSVERRVSFSTPLVTDEWTRPSTAREDIPSLFYSVDDTNRFRQEYRLERKVLTELSINPDTFPGDEDLSHLIADHPSDRHRISRVVVLHNDKLETFLNPDKDVSKANEVSKANDPFSGDFFDNDSFWSGSLTWY